jgi:hypothetical protein
MSILFGSEIPLEHTRRKPARESENKTKNSVRNGRRDGAHIEMNSSAAGHVGQSSGND